MEFGNVRWENGMEKTTKNVSEMLVRELCAMDFLVKHFRMATKAERVARTTQNEKENDPQGMGKPSAKYLATSKV